MTWKENEIVMVKTHAGIVGLFATNHKTKIEKIINSYNKNGWNVVDILTFYSRNILVLYIQAFFLVMTLGVWTMGAKYMIIFEREKPVYNQ